MFARTPPPSPKRARKPAHAWAGHFPYYAGFSESFASAVIAEAKLPPGAVVFDPWNGSGTTTSVAAEHGFASIGFDINPAMVLTARSRMLAPSEADSLVPIAERICETAASEDWRASVDDPLSLLISGAALDGVRRLELAIRRTTVSAPIDGYFEWLLPRVSSLTSTFYVALFSVCRELTRHYATSNPTWIKRPRAPAPATSIRMARVMTMFREKVHAMAAALAARRGGVAELGQARIAMHDATTHGVDPESIDFVLTSPPYCTRIDYTASTRVELALLGPLLATEKDDISQAMMGSIRVPKRRVFQRKEWGPTCTELLDAVRTHESKASAGYYYATHIDYFDKLYRSAKRLHRALKPSGQMIMVVQDSFYKDVHNDLPKIVGEMLEGLGFAVESRHDFRVVRSFADLNPRSRQYDRKSGAVEAVISARRI